MRCPYCSHLESKVLYSRSSEYGTSIRRRRYCLKCHKRFTPYETIDTVPTVVIKKNGNRVTFDRNKILTSMLKACEKRTVSMTTLENCVDEIERTLQNEVGREVTTERIGDLVMEQLKQIDEVAYVRFASVYRQFKDVSTFMEELSKLIADK